MCDWCGAEEAVGRFLHCCVLDICAPCACGVAWMSGVHSCCNVSTSSPINKPHDYQLWSNKGERKVTRCNPVSWAKDGTIIMFCPEGVVVQVLEGGELRDVKSHIVRFVGDGSTSFYYGDRWVAKGRWLPDAVAP
jgi:hypothetical protein